MDINALQAFVAVAETTSFSLAAERLFITQPAVSKRIAALEGELDTQLFDRIGRRVDLTEAGRALLPRARRIQAQVDDSRRAIANLAGSVGGRLDFGTSHHIGLHRLPPFLRRFHTDYPQVEFNIRFLDSEEACRLVEHGELEFAVVTLPLRLPADLLAAPLWDDPLAVVVGGTHLLSRRSQVTLPALLDHPAILPARGTYTRAVVEQSFARASKPLQVSMATNYLETIKMLVAVGLGWSVLPLTMLDDELHQLQVPNLQLRRTLGVVRHPARTLSNAARTMLQALGVSDVSPPENGKRYP